MIGLATAAMLGALSVGPTAAPPLGETAAVALHWEAPERCPAPAQVQRWLDRALADSAAEPDGLEAWATVRPSGEGERMILELRLLRPDAPEGRRVMEAGDCRELAKAAVLIVALAVDPDAKVEELTEAPPDDQAPTPEPPDTEPTGPATPEPPDTEPTGPATPDDPPVEPTEPDTPEPPHARPAEPEPEPADARPAEPDPVPPEPDDPASSDLVDEEPEPDAPEPAVHVGLRAQAAAGISVLPSTTAVVSLVGAVWGRRWRAELGASYWTPVITRPDGTAGGRIEQWTIDARGCGLLRPGPLELPLCAGLDVGAVHGRGRGVTDPQRVASLRLALAAGPALVWRPARLSRRLGLWVGADLLVALVRARFRATPSASGLVLHTPPVGARVGAGAEVRFR